MNITSFALLAGGALILSVFGALMALAEAAFSASSKAELENQRSADLKRAKTLEAIVAEYDLHMAAVSFARVVSESFAAVLLVAAFMQVFNADWGVLLAAAVFILVFSFFTVLAGPKSFGQRNTVTSIRITAGLVRAVRLVLGPIAILILTMSKKSSDRSLDLDEKDKNEQLLSIVDRAAEQDLLEEDEQDIFHSVVEFGDTIVREVMVPRTEMITISSSESISNAFEQLLRSRHSRIPVISGDSDDIVGVIYLRDLAGYIHRKSEESGKQSVKRLMKAPQFVPDLQRADDLFRKMQRESNHLALVVDEHGGIAGLVTMEDLIEELLGEINDEHDREIAEVVQLDDESFVISARLEIEKLGVLFNLELEDEEAQTVSGLISKHLGRLADETDIVVVSGIELSVNEYDKKRHKLKTLKARWVGQEDPSSNKEMVEGQENE